MNSLLDLGGLTLEAKMVQQLHGAEQHGRGVGTAPSQISVFVHLRTWEEFRTLEYVSEGTLTLEASDDF